ncbi:MAG TPA: Crp/Fnr family transcriptional regulator [Acidobacteriota bacterium]|nr:Crp/Fnr family transcriptional regulator [Acidobacteriota bacterium]
MDKLWHLKQCGLMENLGEEDIEAVAGICKDRLYAKGDTLFERGEPANFIYILFRGSVRSAVGDEGGKERIVGFFKTGDVLGENILGPRPAHQSEATAHEECWVGVISRKDFVRLLTQRPSLALNFIRILSEKLGEAREDIKSLSFMGTEERLAQTLIKLGTSHGKEIVSQDCVRKLRFALSHEHLARLIGANRPHVSTIMSGFRKKGFIEYQGRKLLINMKRMATLTDAVPGNGSSTARSIC